MNKNIPFITIALVALIGFFVYSQSVVKPAVIDQPVSDNVQVAEAPEIDETVEVDNTIDIEAGSFYYKPSTLTLKKGEKVTLKFKAVDMMHDFNIDVLGLKIPVTKSGNEVSVEFTPDKVGEFEYYCSVGQHRKNGQIGKLIVTE